MFIKRFAVLAAFIISLFIFTLPVEAKAEYYSEVDFAVEVLEDNTLYVDQEVFLENTSKTYLISHLSFRLPVRVEKLAASMNGQKVPVKSEGSTIEVDISEYHIRPNKKATIRIQYQIAGLVHSNGTLKRLYWPKFKLGADKQNVQFKYPQAWGELEYTNTPPEKILNEGEAKIIKYDGGRDILFSFGKVNNVAINASWVVNNPTQENISIRLPLPSGINNKLVFEAYENFGNGRIDEAGNSYLIHEVAASQSKSGFFSGKLSSEKANDYKGQGGQSSYYTDYQVLEIDWEQDPQKIYRDLLEKFTPQTEITTWERRPLERINEREQQDPLDYAQALTALYRKGGYDAEVVFGLVNTPLIDQTNWHFWVIYREDIDSEWVEVDPFLEDIFNLDFFNDVNPERLVWGVLANEADIDSLGINYYQNLGEIISFTEDEQVLGITANYEVFVNMADTAYAGKPIPIELIIQNYSNILLNIDEVILEDSIFSDEDLGNKVILPGEAEAITIDNFNYNNPFITGTRDIAGQIRFEIGNAVTNVPINEQVEFKIHYPTLISNTFLIFSIVTLITILVRYLFEKYRYHKFKLNRFFAR